MSNVPPYPTDPSLTPRDSHNQDFTHTAARSAQELKDEAKTSAQDIAQTTRDEADRLKREVTHAAQTVRQEAAQKASEFKSEVSEKADVFRQAAAETATRVRESASQRLQETGERAKELHATGENYVRQNPTQALLGAVGVGFLLGLMLRR
jgi:ElaB/YqjD/DUF883 family membrane-anchored ribosome-binding protein